jgi:DNA-binding transcriptional MerR regulator
MIMEKIDNILENLHLDSYLSVDEMPELDLYMDQVIQLFENKLEKSKRNEEEKVLTKTMINNYAKGKLIFPIENKKYSKRHLILISLIYQLKGALSIKDIKVTLDKLNEKVMEEDFNVENVYRSYVNLSKDNVGQFTNNVYDCLEQVKKEVAPIKDEDSEYLEQLLLIASLVNMSNFYRKLAERLVDSITPLEEEKPKKTKKKSE